MKKVQVGYVAIDWIEKKLVITDREGYKDRVPLNHPIHVSMIDLLGSFHEFVQQVPLNHPIYVSMIGHPPPEEQDLIARELEGYILKGYFIMDITFEEILTQ